MDKVLDDVFNSMQSEEDTSTQIESDAAKSDDVERNTELDLDFSEFDEDDSEEDSNEEDDSNEYNNEGFATSKENNAFASMRIQNKDMKSTLDELDMIAKGAGFKDGKEFLAKAKEQSIAKKAKEDGISVELAKKLNEIDEKLETINVKEQQAIYEQKERRLASTLNSFVKSNGLNKESIDKLSNALEKDGITVEKLMDLPDTAILKIFGAYTNLGIQKTLDKKSSINQELPIKQSSKVDSDTINKQLDSFVKEIMGRN